MTIRKFDRFCNERRNFHEIQKKPGRKEDANGRIGVCASLRIIWKRRTNCSRDLGGVYQLSRQGGIDESVGSSFFFSAKPTEPLMRMILITRRG